MLICSLMCTRVLVRFGSLSYKYKYIKILKWSKNCNVKAIHCIITFTVSIKTLKEILTIAWSNDTGLFFYPRALRSGRRVGLLILLQKNNYGAANKSFCYFNTFHFSAWCAQIAPFFRHFFHVMERRAA